MIIVGITGAIGHGKTTLADYLGQEVGSYQHYESSQIIVEVANALRRSGPLHPAVTDMEGINNWLTSLTSVLNICVHLSPPLESFALTTKRLNDHPEHYEKLFAYLSLMESSPELQTVEITADNKATFRPFLQWLGGYLVKTVSPGIWYEEIMRRIRMNAERGMQLATIGGLRFPQDAEIIRNNGGFILEIKRPGSTNLDLDDITERERKLIAVDAVVSNDSNLADLQQVAHRIYHDLKHRDLRPSYQASQSDR